MIPGKAHQNAEAEKRKPWRDYYWAPYLEAPSISRRVFASIVYAWRLFSSPDEKRRGFFFYHAYIFANKIGQLFRVRTETTYNDGVIGKTRPTKVEFYFDMRS